MRTIFVLMAIRVSSSKQDGSGYFRQGHGCGGKMERKIPFLQRL